ncbi:MAG: hypothetical protein J0M02_15720 [Planctomycetes bacterium]|nr:hypothetical protein [Planctomycetota bacterium]
MTPVLLLALPVLATAAVVEDFSTAPGLELVQASARGTSAAVEAAPGGANLALVLRLAEQHGKLHEVYLLTGVAQQGAATVTVRARATGTAELWSLALRVRDAKGETFQFATRAKPAATWTDLVYEVRDGAQQGSWGTPTTGAMGGTWRVSGFGLSCREKSGTAEVWIDDIACVPAQAP